MYFIINILKSSINKVRKKSLINNERGGSKLKCLTEQLISIRDLKPSTYLAIILDLSFAGRRFQQVHVCSRFKQLHRKRNLEPMTSMKKVKKQKKNYNNNKKEKKITCTTADQNEPC